MLSILFVDFTKSIFRWNYESTSKRFAMISAYNSGAGAVLRVFDNDKDMAIYKINQMYQSKFIAF